MSVALSQEKEVGSGLQDVLKKLDIQTVYSLSIDLGELPLWFGVL